MELSGKQTDYSPQTQILQYKYLCILVTETSISKLLKTTHTDSYSYKFRKLQYLNRIVKKLISIQFQTNPSDITTYNHRFFSMIRF